MARSAEARIKAQGSAKHGAGHFIAERVSAIALVPLSLWAVFAVIALAPLPYEGVVAWLQSPTNLILAVLFVAMAFYHMGIGMKVVVEDYIHKPSSLVLLLLLNTLVWGVGGVVAVVCLLKVAFTGAVA